MGAHCNFYSQIKTLAFLQLIKYISHIQDWRIGGCWSGCQHGRLNIVVRPRPESSILYSFTGRNSTSQFQTFVEIKGSAKLKWDAHRFFLSSRESLENKIFFLQNDLRPYNGHPSFIPFAGLAIQKPILSRNINEKLLRNAISWDTVL